MASLDYDTRPSTYAIYTGVWEDWTKGRVLGATLTLNRRDGALLIAFLALFVSVVGTHFWRISCFALHHLYSTQAAQDALHHQSQAILRNAANGTSGLCSFIELLVAWTRRAEKGQRDYLAKKPYRRTLPLIAFSLVCMTAFGAAGTFSSKISTALGNEVLIRSTNCGVLNAEAHYDIGELLTYFYPYQSQMMSSFSSYAEQCYSNVSDMSDCNAFIKRQIPTTIDRNASCPFGDGICKQDHGNIVFDTGFLDSHADFGINTPPDERVLFRRVSSCAPIKTDGYRKTFQSNETGNNYTRYYYGEAFGDGSQADDDNAYTYEYPEFIWAVGKQRQDLTGAGRSYTIDTASAYPINGSYLVVSEYDPIPALQVPSADVHLFFLSGNMVRYANPVDDLWYAAHRNDTKVGAVGMDGESAGSIGMYNPDASTSVLACSVKEQFCNPNLPGDERCAPFGGTFESEMLAEGLWQNERHERVFGWFGSIFRAYGITLLTAPGILGPSALTARYKLQDGFSGPLPDNQWQLETEYWHAASLVATQGIMALTANGPSDSNQEPWLVRPNNTVEEQLCQSQKIKNLEYFNFSILALALTVGLGGAIVCLAYVLEPLVSWIQRRRNLDVYARLEWNTNDTLQLQRLAHEEMGIGTWSKCAGAVPVTEKGERLAVLDLRDLGHPRLKAPPSLPEEGTDTESDGKEARTTTTSVTDLESSPVMDAAGDGRRAEGGVSI